MKLLYIKQSQSEDAWKSVPQVWVLMGNSTDWMHCNFINLCRQINFFRTKIVACFVKLFRCTWRLWEIIASSYSLFSSFRVVLVLQFLCGWGCYWGINCFNKSGTCLSSFLYLLLLFTRLYSGLRGYVDHFSFFDCSIAFCFVLIEFHCYFFHLL